MAEKGQQHICLLEERGMREGARFKLCLQEERPEVLGGMYSEGGGEGGQGERGGMKRKEGRGGMGTSCNPG